MLRAYRLLLRVYPRDYREMFAREMESAFQVALAEHSGLRFLAAEFSGLLAGAVAEWFAKMTTDRAVRGRCLPDRLLMRPAGVSWEAFYGQSVTASATGEAALAQRVRSLRECPDK